LTNEDQWCQFEKSSKTTINWHGQQAEQLLALAIAWHQCTLLFVASTIAVLSLLIAGGEF